MIEQKFNYAKKLAEEINRIFGCSVTVEYGKIIEGNNSNVPRETIPNDTKTGGDNNA